MSANDLLEIARNMIEHEDDLLNHRISWFLVFQGLLFTAYFQAISLFEGTKLPNHMAQRRYVLYALVVVCAVGAFSALVTGFSIGAAENQIDEVAKWWKCQSKGDLGELPLTGSRGLRLTDSIVLTGAHFSGAFAAVWAVLLVLLLIAARRALPAAGAEDTSAADCRQQPPKSNVERQEAE